MRQRTFIVGTQSLNEEDLQENLECYKVPQTGTVIESIRSKLVLQISDEYANILKGMYSTKFNGCPKDSDVYGQTDSVPGRPMPPLITSLRVCQDNNIRLPREKEKKGDG